MEEKLNQTQQQVAETEAEAALKKIITSNPILCKELIAELREKYDYVLLDCAPVLQVSDYIHIAKVSDGVILLVAYATTSKFAVADAVAELKKNDVKLLGTVFTMYDRKKDYGHAFGYKYYGYGYTAEGHADVK